MRHSFILRRRHLTALSIVVLMPPWAHISQAALLKRPPMTRSAARTQQADAAGCQWTYYPISGGQLQPEQPLFNDPDNTPINSLTVGNPFTSNARTHASLATTGSIDFDGDGRTDVLRTWPRPDGFLQWQYSSGGVSAWRDLAYAGSSFSASTMRFGEFDGDNLTDVFDNEFSTTMPQWLYSSAGTEDFAPLFPNPPGSLERVVVGDFNGDGHSDIFTAFQQDSTYGWNFYPSQGGLVGAPQSLAGAPTDPSVLRFADFDADGKTDVFIGDKLDNGSTLWLYSSGGTAGYQQLIARDVPYSELQFGDFDGDGFMDALSVLPADDGGENVTFYEGLVVPVSLGKIADPRPALRVGDFNGDGTADLLALRCGLTAPLTFGPRQFLAYHGYQAYKTFAGDVDGDGDADVILVSTCNLFCPVAMGAALSRPGGKYQLKLPQHVGADGMSLPFDDILAGDFDGDGKTDVAFVRRDTSTLTLYVAHSNGDGSFTLEGAETFGNEAWSQFYSATGDFNGDGKTDLAFTTVCNLTVGECRRRNEANHVYVATSTGSSFTLGGRQDLSGSTDWTWYEARIGDFNGDGKADVVFNSTCQRNADFACTGDANIIYTALSTGFGGFTMSVEQTYGSSGWKDFPAEWSVVGDLNADGRSDLVWTRLPHTESDSILIRAALANPDGTFQLGPSQDFGNEWNGRLTLADLNHDHKADLVWNGTLLSADVDAGGVERYAAAISNGNGTFQSLGQGGVYTGPGNFMLPQTDPGTPLPTGITVVSTSQDAISDALVVVHGELETSCVGDCSGDGAVTVDEILTLVNIALGNADVSTCLPGDANHDMQITIDEILTAVNHALNGCPSA